MRRIISFILLISMLLSGCGGPGRKHFAVLCKICVVREYQGMQTERIYTDSGKMRQILNGLRSLGEESTPEIDPELIRQRCYKITLIHTDGSKTLYQTKGDRYIRRGDAPWQQANPEMVSRLNLLLQSLPGD